MGKKLHSLLSAIDFSDYYDRINRAFWDFFDSTFRIRISVGGAGSGKSFSTFQEIIYKIIVEPGHNYLICRKVGTTNKTSTYALLQQIIADLGLGDVFKENKSDLTFTCIPTGGMIVFKGLDDIEKIKSMTFPTGPLTDIVIEEASEISQPDFDQLNVRLRGIAKVPFQLTLLLNPIHDQHWIKREFFDLQSYQKTFPVYILKTTYLDNEFLDDDYRSVLESYKDIDYEFYRVYCLGEWGSIGKNIFNHWKVETCPYKEEDFDATYIGIDWGYVHPSVIVKVGLKDGTIYTYSELAITDKTNPELIAYNEELQVFRKGESATADSAEPARIKEWVQAGYSVLPAKKPPGSVRRGIDFMKSHKWIIDPSCVRTIQEVQIYHWKTKKNGEVVRPEEPIEISDDAIKAHFYALEVVSHNKGKPGVLSGTVSESKKEIIEIRRDQRKKIKEAIMAQRKRRREELEKLENKK